MTTFTCPNGHKIDTDMDAFETPVCTACKLTATHYNARTGEVYTWTPTAKHRAACARLQDEMDAAFDNQYFGGGW